ncbi:TonB-dependent receptor [Edaphobacter flagellatus]|uniref:TonB-dependent receptor n=1 Tax=Edaphobacter flagellatus TaxID=1933044 RepID=UPI0021B48CCD|nr:TonB-dependent receptor [Edaphobacter flagellatus]
MLRSILGGRFALTWVIFLFVAAPLLAQTGSVTGTVVDVQGRALQGAKVVTSPGSFSALSDAQGQFTLKALNAGDYILTVDYVGFATSTQHVTVAAGQPVRLDVSMKVADTRQDVQVYAGREGGEVEAINRTFNADNIINVLPADVITSLPNANVADAIGRLPSVTLERDEGEGKYVQVRGTEPRLTNTMIDGVNIASAETVRQVKLDIIPANLVESVQINKTLQANMPGDGIGGSVDLRTKSAGEKPTVALESTGGYTPIIGGRPVYQFDGTVGRRFLEDNKLGLLFGGSYDWNGRGINDVEPGPFYLGGYDQRNYQYYRSRTGFAGTADYRFSDTSSIYLKGLYSLFHNYGNRWDYNFSTSFDANYQPVAGSGSMSFGAEIRRPVQDIGSLQLGGHHLMKNSLLNWDVESSIGRTRDEGYDDASFVNNNNYSFAADVSNPLVPKLKALNGANVYDPTQYYLSLLRTNNYYNPEVDLGFGASLSTAYTVGGHASTFEFGGRFRNLHKFANQDTLYFVPTASITNPNDPSLQMTQLLSSFSDSNYYGGSYAWGPAADYTKIKAVPAVPVPADMRNKHNTDQIGQNFNYIEKVGAGYVMNTVNLGRFRIVAGLRFEATNNSDVGTVTPDAPPVARSGSYLDVLPSASVRYAFTPSSGLRLVYGRGLSRPDFADLVSFASVSPGGVRTTSSIGNPNLKAEHADNIDLLYEQSLNPIGLLQAGVFYKNLQDPILPLNTTLSDGTIQTQPQNAGSAYVYGFEIAFQQHFTYLPGMLNGLGLSANYGYSASQVTWPKQVCLSSCNDPANRTVNIDRTDHPDLLRQAPHTWNISPTYDKRNLSMRLGLSYNAANIFAYNYTDTNASGPFDPTAATGGGIKGPNGDVYLYGHLQVDLQGTYRLPKGFTAVGYALNLNNEVFGFYQGSTIYPIQREFYRQTFGGGLRWSPSHEK